MNAKKPLRPSEPKAEMRLRPGRASLLFACIGILFCVLVVRAFYLQWGAKGSFLQSMSGARVEGIVEIPATRGVIYDRNGKELAVSLPVKALFARPDVLEISDKNIALAAKGMSPLSGGSGNSKAAAKQNAAQTREAKKVESLEAKRAALAKILGVSVGSLRSEINQDKPLVYLARRMQPSIVNEAMALKIKGLGDEESYWRSYPLAGLTSQLIGFTGDGDKGQEGIELSMQSELQSHPGSRRVIRNIKKEAIDEVGEVTLPRNGKDVTLSIDTRIQELAFSAIKKAVLEHQAKSGSVIVLDAETGEVLADVNWPSFNPNDVADRDSKYKKNRAIVDLFEPGSTFKPLTAALALNLGKVTPQSRFPMHGGQLKVGKYIIHDAEHESMPDLSVEDIIKRSSNVGISQVAFRMTPEEMWTGLTDFGIGVRPGTGFPGEAAGRLMPAKRWGKVEQATISYGHGVSVSLLQIARAYTVFVNGELLPVSLYCIPKKDDGKPVKVYGKPVVSPKVAAEMRSILENVTHQGGTGFRAQVPGYRVAGKTGTARKAENGGYSRKKYVSSFVGFAPVAHPKLIVAVMVDEPMKGYYGAQVAAPVFSDIVGKALHQLNVPPDYPVTSFKPLKDVKDVPEET
jgi:cell division protein FtsI (penicillin-binding protein 3)